MIAQLELTVVTVVTAMIEAIEVAVTIAATVMTGMIEEDVIAMTVNHVNLLVAVEASLLRLNFLLAANL
jgi:hypothetical protein